MMLSVYLSLYMYVQHAQLFDVGRQQFRPFR
jgi:hypothetical protein